MKFFSKRAEHVIYITHTILKIHVSNFLISPVMFFLNVMELSLAVSSSGKKAESDLNTVSTLLKAYFCTTNNPILI